MTGRILRLSPIALLALLVTACGGTKTVTVTQTETVTTTVTATTQPPSQVTPVRVYFLRDGRVAPVSRFVPKTTAVGRAALEALLAGPTPEERAIGLTTDFSDGTRLLHVSVDGGVASVAVDGTYGRAGLAQLVYTALQFPTVQSVASGQQRLRRSTFEDVTPAILVDSPLPFATVGSPLRATGTANTFEATFEYDLVDADGNVIGHHFVTATSGSGTRGTFDFSVPFTVARSGPGKLVVFESSAANGQRIHVVEIPLRLEP